jgi:hypothetical protein
MIAKSSVTEMITRVIEILEWITHQMKLNLKLQETLTDFGKVLSLKPKIQ